jgi:tRNA pseudouridine38-40 synthase
VPRYRLTIEYDGGPFVGWQRQAEGQSVQQCLEDAILAFCGESAGVRGAGRTDAGVHALGQVAHLDLEREWPCDTVSDALNAHLRPQPIAVLDAEIVDDEFDARFSATMRHYRYRIINRRAPLTVERGRAWRVGRQLDAARMHQAGQALTGTHDFTTFRAIECQAKSPVKTVSSLAVTRTGAEIVLEVSARSFLHHQVRSFAGSLRLVGEGKWSAGDLQAALQAKDRTQCGPVAPANGLYLVQVDY